MAKPQPDLQVATRNAMRIGWQEGHDLTCDYGEVCSAHQNPYGDQEAAPEPTGDVITDHAYRKSTLGHDTRCMAQVGESQGSGYVCLRPREEHAR